MSPRRAALLLAFAGLAWITLGAAQSGMLILKHNPFSRPEVLKPKPAPPPAPPRAVVVPPEQMRLNLTATLVSETAPMVMVDGELLAIGDRIEGLKLIAVMEGKAVFLRHGKKYAFEINDGQKK